MRKCNVHCSQMTSTTIVAIKSMTIIAIKIQRKKMLKLKIKSFDVKKRNKQHVIKSMHLVAKYPMVQVLPQEPNLPPLI